MRLISISNGETSVDVCVNLCSVVSSLALAAPTIFLFSLPLYSGGKNKVFEPHYAGLSSHIG